MKLLLDTSAFLWFVLDSDRLPPRTRTALREAETEVWLSVVSVWEVLVKSQIGRLTLPEPAWPYVTRLREQHGIDSLPLDHCPPCQATGRSPRPVRSHSRLPGYSTRLADCHQRRGSSAISRQDVLAAID